ncbi:hypothetical protein M427DRAFT_42348 [Gonapodya prolifera JEL478]|uniref:Uncharacterized protein n=1 Tax=Gonapodya prolifera (strain JEL478) TaxID=1344416 RepID=A0A139APK3_GONPJ|nr:hypothetical protein M427DRAFT_42348 [Gonapodya prolifera JEL478]|eukprot:KXS18679.1 hypothetical protein M427DRAFT_42348 [Gonapodya prolifera JEL478]
MDSLLASSAQGDPSARTLPAARGLPRLVLRSSKADPPVPPPPARDGDLDVSVRRIVDSYMQEISGTIIADLKSKIHVPDGDVSTIEREQAKTRELQNALANSQRREIEAVLRAERLEKELEQLRSSLAAKTSECTTLSSDLETTRAHVAESAREIESLSRQCDDLREAANRMSNIRVSTPIPADEPIIDFVDVDEVHSVSDGRRTPIQDLDHPMRPSTTPPHSVTSSQAILFPWAHSPGAGRRATFAMANTDRSATSSVGTEVPPTPVRPRPPKASRMPVFEPLNALPLRDKRKPAVIPVRREYVLENTGDVLEDGDLWDDEERSAVSDEWTAWDEAHQNGLAKQWHVPATPSAGPLVHVPGNAHRRAQSLHLHTPEPKHHARPYPAPAELKRKRSRVWGPGGAFRASFELQ